MGPRASSIVVVLAVASSACLQAASDTGGSLSIDVADTMPYVERPIAPGLRLEIRRDVSATGDMAGWDVAVFAASGNDQGNLLYHSREWHGPYPTQVYAWSEAMAFFGRGARELEVRGHPWVVEILCDRCVTDGEGDLARFTSGELIVEWRRVDPSEGKP